MLGQVVRGGVKVAAAGVDVARGALRAPRHGITVLAYHDVGGPGPSEVNLPTGLFEQQIAGLAEAGSVIGLDEAVQLLVSGAPIHRPLVVVTFDDGTAGFVEHAVPVLARYGVPATLYVATEWVDEQRSFWDDGTVLSWAALAEAMASGVVQVGSHSHSHLLFDRTPAPELADDLDRSTDLLGTHLDVAVEHFAYPKALAPSPEAAAVVAQRFTSAALAGTRSNHVGGDPLRLARSPVQVSDGIRWFRRKAAGGMGTEDDLRRLLGRVRYRGATS